MTVGLSQAPQPSVDSESLRVLLRFIGIAGLVGGGSIAAHQFWLNQVTFQFESSNNKLTQRASRPADSEAFQAKPLVTQSPSTERSSPGFSQSVSGDRKDSAFDSTPSAAPDVIAASSETSSATSPVTTPAPSLGSFAGDRPSQIRSQTNPSTQPQTRSQIKTAVNRLSPPKRSQQSANPPSPLRSAAPRPSGPPRAKTAPNVKATSNLEATPSAKAASSTNGTSAPPRAKPKPIPPPNFAALLRKPGSVNSAEPTAAIAPASDKPALPIGSIIATLPTEELTEESIEENNNSDNSINPPIDLSEARPIASAPDFSEANVSAPNAPKPNVSKPDFSATARITPNPFIPTQSQTAPDPFSLPGHNAATPPPDTAEQPQTDLETINKPVPSQPPIESIPLAVTPALEPAAAPQKVFVDRFNVTGSTVFSPEELAIVARTGVEPETDAEQPKPTTPEIQRELSPSELVRASEKVTQFYTEQGYINSGAYVPEEVLEGAAPEIRVVEGGLEKIEVDVQPPKSSFGLGRPLRPSYVESRLARATQTPLNINDLVDGVRLLEQDPLIERISTELVQGEETGNSILNVDVLPANPFSATLSTDNSRSPSVGSIQQNLALTQANLLGIGDRLSFGFGRSSGSHSVDFGYSIPVNAKDGTVSLRHSRSSSTVIEEPFKDLDIESKARTYELSYRQPLIRNPNQELGLSFTASRRNSEGFFLDGATPFPSRGADEDGKTRISALRFGQDWTRRAPNQVLSLQSEVNWGNGAFGATLNDDPDEPDSKFLYWRGRGQWVRRLGSDTLLSLKGDLQLSANPLVSSEQFGLGGASTIRGYRSNTLLTDSGWLASAELQFPILQIPNWDSKVKLVPFFEVGRGWNLGNTEQPDPNQLMSTGLGLIWDVGDRFRARIDWGLPLTSVEQDGNSLQDSGVNFSVRWNAF